MVEKEKASFKLLIKFGSEVALEVGEEEDMADSLLAEIKDLERKEQNKKILKNWFVGFHFITWKDEILLQTLSGKEVAIRTTNAGIGTQFGRRWSNAYKEYAIAIGYALADATVGDDDKNVNYFQKGVAVSLLTLGSSYHWKPDSGNVAIGPEGILVLRTGNFEEPPQSHGIDNKSIMTVGVLASLKWQISFLDLQMRIGKVINMPSSMISLGGIYHF